MAVCRRHSSPFPSISSEVGLLVQYLPCHGVYKSLVLAELVPSPKNGFEFSIITHKTTHIHDMAVDRRFLFRWLLSIYDAQLFFDCFIHTMQ